MTVICSLYKVRWPINLDHFLQQIKLQILKIMTNYAFLLLSWVFWTQLKIEYKSTDVKLWILSRNFHNPPVVAFYSYWFTTFKSTTTTAFDEHCVPTAWLYSMFPTKVQTSFWRISGKGNTETYSVDVDYILNTQCGEPIQICWPAL